MEKYNTRTKISLPFPLIGSSHLKNMFRMFSGPVQAGCEGRQPWANPQALCSHEQQLRQGLSSLKVTFCSLSTIPSLPGCDKSEDRQGRRDEGQGQRLENPKEVVRTGTGGHSQVLSAYLQTAANGVLVYFRGPRTPTPGKAYSCPHTRQVE